MVITIYGQLYSLKNSKRIAFNRKTKRPILIKSKSAMAADDGLALQLQSKLGTWNDMTTGLQFPYYVTLTIYRQTKAKFDYINIAQQLFDSMVKACYLPDDSMEYLIPVFNPYQVDKENPRCEISVE
jgi:hypothetical protein